MSQPSVSLPSEIREMMTNTVRWEKFLGFDGHAEPSYAAPVTLTCFREAHGLMQGGYEVIRVADETTGDPDWDLFFSGDDANARLIGVYDRFTMVGAQGDAGSPLQAQAVNTITGPNWDNADPWLIVVIT